MGKVVEIGIADIKGNQMQKVSQVEALEGKGLLHDRKFREKNQKACQVTLIEIENINYYNNKTGTFIPPNNFTRNIITERIQLNQLIGREFLVGKVKLRAHDLCRPCKYLQESLGQKNLVKLMLQKSGLRCEILTDGKIFIGDKIES